VNVTDTNWLQTKPSLTQQHLADKDLRPMQAAQGSGSNSKAAVRALMTATNQVSQLCTKGDI
jgi:hypothetical protein